MGSTRCRGYPEAVLTSPGVPLESAAGTAVRRSRSAVRSSRRTPRRSRTGHGNELLVRHPRTVLHDGLGILAHQISQPRLVRVDGVRDRPQPCLRPWIRVRSASEREPGCAGRGRHRVSPRTGGAASRRWGVRTRPGSINATRTSKADTSAARHSLADSRAAFEAQ